MLISPAVTISKPAIIRRIVDLPQPDGPSSARNPPSSTSKLIESTGVTPGAYVFVRFRAVMRAMRPVFNPAPVGHRMKFDHGHSIGLATGGSSGNDIAQKDL